MLLKLQPHRTIHLRGFDDRGAAAALHSATSNSFVVSGVFRDSADFCVLMLWDADNFFEHPRLKYLPDFDFSGMVLSFDVQYSGLMPLDSSLYPSIDWPFLDVIRPDGSTDRVRLVPEGGNANHWHVTIDFTAAGIDQIRQAWLTFAPPIPAAQPYIGGEWEARFTAWTVADPLNKRPLRVSGPGSVRIEETDSWCSYDGTSWSVESGFYSNGFAKRVSSPGDSVTVEYFCQHTHNLWLGTSLYLDRGRALVRVDGDAATICDCRLQAEPAVVTRRLLRSNLPPGPHEVKLTHLDGGPVYFDFLEASVPSDPPPPETIHADLAPANDYGTDHTYKLPPARLLWMLDHLGFHGSLNVYVSVFWWNQRRAEGRILPQVTVKIPQAAVVPGFNVFVRIGGETYGRYVIPGDTPSTVAFAIRDAINATAVGVWAGVWSEFPYDRLFIGARSAAPSYSFSFEAWYETPTRVNIPFDGSLQSGSPGRWVIDETARPVLNRGARDWLADLCRECAERGRELTLAYSMELLYPPPAWAARFPDGSPVETATGFATNVTTHCSFVSGMLEYHKHVYLETANIMAAAGLPVRLQVGEFVWWFFANASGMAFHDDETQAAARTALGRPLHHFLGPDDDPAINGYADANFLAGRLVWYVDSIRNHVRATHPTAELEILLPYDVNYPRPIGHYNLGGRLLYYINARPFLHPATAPVDRVKMEALDFGSGTRSLDLAKEAIRLPYSVGSWPKAKVRYLAPWFNGGCPWPAELEAAQAEGLPGINFWAFDHLCLFGWPVDSPPLQPGVQEL